MNSSTSPNRNDSLSLANGAFQVYNEPLSDLLSEVLSGFLNYPRLYCFAQDWRGNQFFILDKLTQNDPETIVYGYDPARGLTDDLMPYGALLLKIKDATILNGCALDEFAFWLKQSNLSRLDVGKCITPRVFLFLGGSEDDVDTEPRSSVAYVISSLKMKVRLNESGLKDGDVITKEFFNE